MPQSNFKKTIYRSEQYKAFVRELRCIVPGCESIDSDPHHTYRAGAHLKGPDHCCVPLCRGHHSEVDNIGRATFEKKHNVSIAIELIRVLMKYACHCEGANHDMHDWNIRGLTST